LALKDPKGMFDKENEALRTPTSCESLPLKDETAKETRVQQTVVKHYPYLFNKYCSSCLCIKLNIRDKSVQLVYGLSRSQRRGQSYYTGDFKRHNAKGNLSKVYYKQNQN